MTKKITVGVIFGGRSAEHEVSLRSAKNVVEAIDKNLYDVVLIGIDRDGKWHLNDTQKFLAAPPAPDLVLSTSVTKDVVLIEDKGKRSLVSLSGDSVPRGIDVVFPVLHGPFGEDGTVQGLLKLANVPFVGPGVLGSAVGMDKDVMKRLLRDAGIAIPKFLVFSTATRNLINFKSVAAELGMPLFIKPANLGSSVGISKVKDEPSFLPAVAKAFDFDRKILIEEFIDGREIECAVLGNDDPIASVPGEIVPSSSHEFYNYESKYLDEHGAALKIPAPMPERLSKSIQELALHTFKALCLEGMARVDLFLAKDERCLVNEVNTIPGFTNISMYPQLFAASGIPYKELISRLIQHAIERFNVEQSLKTSHFS